MMIEYQVNFIYNRIHTKVLHYFFFTDSYKKQAVVTKKHSLSKKHTINI